MIFRVFAKDELPNLFGVLSSNRIVGPVLKGQGKDGKLLFAFEEVSDFSRMRLDYSTTVAAPKKFFLPYKETLCTFHVQERDWVKEVDYNVSAPTVLFGLHSCDINALNRLDKVLMDSPYPTPYYAAKRKNMFIVGMDCDPNPACFCRSMGTDTALTGFDMFLTDLGDRYFVEILSATAFNFVQQTKAREPLEADHHDFMRRAEERNKKFTSHVDSTDLTKILDMEFQSQTWEEWGKKCLSCGTCARVCPTCYCYGSEQVVDLNLSGAKKINFLYSCNLVDFAKVAGGHNFRPQSHTRLKYRYYHKHRGFVEAFEEPLCVGCGRCGEACLAEITVPEVIASVRGGQNGND